MERLGKHVSTSTITYIAIKVLLETAFAKFGRAEIL
jgi:hypothetical protein